jgi:membrane peptidoglycan carboxypeptidase
MTPAKMLRYVIVQRRQRRRGLDQSGPAQVLRGLAVLLIIVVLVVVGVVAGSVGSATGVYAYFTRDLPALEGIEVAEQNFETTKIYDRTGKILLYEVIDPTGGDRTWVKLSELPDSLVCATVAIEDRNFWTNRGFNPRGIARALWDNIRGNDIQGGSSITQQLVKNTIIEPERRVVGQEGPQWKDYERKITEGLLAMRATEVYSKEQILEWYLNTNFYGNLAYGIQAAARVYFNKHVDQLTLAEAATLAAIPQFPYMNPFDNPEDARQRQNIVLDEMEAYAAMPEEHGGFDCQIDPEQIVAAKYEPWELARLTERYDIEAPHFSVYVRRQLEDMYGPELVYRGGLRVYTTLDLDLNEQAQCVARAQIRRLSGEDEATVIQQAIDSGCSAAQFLPPLRQTDIGRDHEVSNAAVIALRPATGEILAMVGSLDYWDEEIDGQYNVAVDGLGRQPGSSFKPFTYVTMLSQGHNAAHMFLDARTAFQQSTGFPYVPENYDRKYHGPQRLRLALARSYNIPAVAALDIAGVDNVLRTSHRMGIDTLDRGLDYYGLSLTLGGGEVHLLDMVYAYGVFGNGGKMYGEPVLQSDLRPGYRELNPVSILRVEDRDGNVIYQYDQPESREILSPQLAYIMNSILSDNRSRWAAMGRPNAMELSGERPAAAKTGTTNDYKDAWTVGYTPQIVAGVWVGNSDNSEMRFLSGLAGAAPVWHAVMEYALQGQTHDPFARPDGLTETTVCAVSGKLPTEHCPVVNELFIPGTEPTDQCPIHRAFHVNRETGLLCTVHTPPELCEERVYEVYPPEAADWIASLAEDQRPPTPPTEFDTIYGPTRGDADAAITEPAPYSYIRGQVPVMGSAKGGDFNYYRVMVGEGLNPIEWIQVGPEHRDQVQQGLLEMWDTSAFDGLYSLRLSIVDHSNAVREATIQVTVDNISPTVDLTYPYDGAEYEIGHDEWANVNAEVADYSVARVEFYEYAGSKEIDPPPDLAPFAVRTVAPFNVNWTLRDVGLGAHTFYVVAVDAAGNQTTSNRVTIFVVAREEEP